MLRTVSLASDDFTFHEWVFGVEMGFLSILDYSSDHDYRSSPWRDRSMDSTRQRVEYWLMTRALDTWGCGVADDEIDASLFYNDDVEVGTVRGSPLAIQCEMVERGKSYRNIVSTEAE
jgi:hypothetical protein